MRMLAAASAALTVALLAAALPAQAQPEPGDGDGALLAFPPCPPPEPAYLAGQLWWVVACPVRHGYASAFAVTDPASEPLRPAGDLAMARVVEEVFCMLDPMDLQCFVGVHALVSNAVQPVMDAKSAVEQALGSGAAPTLPVG